MYFYIRIAVRNTVIYNSLTFFPSDKFSQQEAVIQYRARVHDCMHGPWWV